MTDITLNNQLRSAVNEIDCGKVKQLLENGADPNWFSMEHSVHANKGRTLSIAIAHGSAEVVSLLLQFGADVNFPDVIVQGFSPLTQAILQHVDPDVVRLLIASGADINLRSPNGQSSMLYLLSESTLPYAELLPLIDKIEDIQERYYLTGETFLHLVRGREDDDDKLALMEKLIHAGISVNSTDYEGDTPLHNIASICCLDSVQFLLDSGADLHARNNNTETVLHTLADNSSYPTFDNCLKYCVEKGADINAIDRYGGSILHHAASAEETPAEVLSGLVELGVVLNIRDSFGKNEIHNAVSKIKSGFNDEMISQCMDFVRALVDVGVDINAPDLDGLTPLHMAANKHSKEALQTLLDLGADITTKSKCGVTPLHLAALRYDLGPQLIDWHVKHDCSVDVRDEYGSTPLHYAVWFREQTVLKHLLQNGADRSIADNTGAAPADVAEMIHYDDYMALEKTFQELPRLTSGDSVEQDFHGNDPFEECPFSEYIYIESGEQNLNIEEWTEHISIHKKAINNFINILLASRNMGLFYDVEANLKIPLLVENLMHMLAARVAQRNPLFQCELWLAGSVFEGTKIGVMDEFDYIWCLSEFSKCFTPVEAMSFSNGFVKLRINQDGGESLYSDFIDADGYMDMRRVIFTLYTLLNEEVLKMSQDGDLPNTMMLGNVLECDRGTLSNFKFYYCGQHAKFISISVDMVPTVLPQNWKPKDFAHESTLVLQNVKRKVPFSIVMKCPDAYFVKEPTLYFRKSYASWEQSAIRSFPSYIRKGYIVVKALVDSSFFPDIVQSDTMDVSRFITSYRLKTCFLYQLEKALRDDDPSLYINETDIEECNKISIEWARRIVRQFDDFVHAGNLPSFFEPNKNLLFMEGATEVFNMHLYEGASACLKILLDFLQ